MTDPQPDSIVARLKAAWGEVAGAQMSAQPSAPLLTQIQAEILRAAEGSGGYEQVKAALERTQRELALGQTFLNELLKRVEMLASHEKRRERYTDAGLAARQTELSQLGASNPADAAARWLEAIAEAIADWELSAAVLLAQSVPCALPAAAEWQKGILKGLEELRIEPKEQAAAMLEELAGAGTRDGIVIKLPDEIRGRLLVCLGRCRLRAEDSARALADFEKARGLLERDGEGSAGLGDYYRGSEPQRASRFYQQAIELTPECSSGYLGLGLLAEDHQRWDEARDWFDRAIAAVQNERDGESALGRLLAPVSGSVLLRYAQRLASRDKASALHAVTRALRLGIRGAGTSPEKAAYRLQGELLEAHGERAAAGEAFYEAGRRAGWRDEKEEARDLLMHARDLNPTCAPIYWCLMDAWRRLSYLPSPPYVDAAAIGCALEAWEKGLAFGEIQPADSWALVTRGVLCEQEGRLRPQQNWEYWWQAVALIEQAVMLYRDDPYRWVYLGVYFRYLGLYSCALAANQFAFEAVPNDAFVLQERISDLCDLGEFGEASTLTRQVPNMEESWFGRALTAYILYYTRQLERAEALAEQCVAEDPGQLWIRQIAAEAARLRGNPQKADAHEVWTWSKRDDPQFIGEMGSLPAIARSGYKVGAFAPAADLFTELQKTQLGSPSIGLGLSLCRCALGELKEGGALLLKSLKGITTVREIDDFLGLDVPLIEGGHGGWGRTEAGRELLEQARATALQRRAEVSQRPSARAEISRVLDELAAGGKVEGWPWLGARAALARFYSEANEGAQALPIYEELLRSGRFAPVAGALRKLAKGPVKDA